MESKKNYKYGIKSTISQCLAIMGACFLQVGLGAELICPTFIIGALSNSTETGEQLPMTEEQASWFGSLLYLSTPMGSVLSSVTLNRFGHKNCMIASNVPYLASQIMFLYANSITTLYIGSIMMGLSIGFSGGPFSAYVGEVCEPKLRGALSSATNVFFFAGSLLFSTIYAVTRQWRLTILINLAIPIVTILILLKSPDSPMWLLYRGKTEKAQRMLRKLRGWASNDKCSSEFEEMVVFASNNKESGDDEDDQESSWKQLLQPEVLRPLRLIFFYFFFVNLLSGVPFGPYLVEVFEKFGANVDVHWTIAFSVCLAIVAGILTIFLVNRLGKRFLTLSTLSICSVCHLSIGVIGVYWTDTNLTTSWSMLILFLLSTFMASFGILPIGWILLSEIFPMKSRKITCSICSTLTYILTFFMTKYYLNFVDLVGFYYTFIVFGIGGVFGCVYFYFYLPETENKTLQEITEFFK